MTQDEINNAIDGQNLVGHKKTVKRTNAHGTCLWCGSKLRRHVFEKNREGGYADNAFCGLRCGYRFGLALAAARYRLQVYPPPEKVKVNT